MGFGIDIFNSNQKDYEQINLAIFAREFSEVSYKLKNHKANIKGESISKIVDFLKVAQEYSEGKISTTHNILPSDAFIYTMKAIDFANIENDDFSGIVKKIIDDLNKIISGEYEKNEELIRFIDRLSSNLEKEESKAVSSQPLELLCK